MISRLLGLVACVLVSACASTQLNYNASDLATSLNSLAKKQIFYNLAQAFSTKQFVPSQVTISSGSATTSNSITPNLGIPLGSGLSTSSAIAANGGISSTNQFTLAAPTLGLSVSDGWNQSWTLSPPNDPNQLGRLRSLYLYVTGYPGWQLSPEAAKRRFVCDYPYQALAIALSLGGPASAGNVAANKQLAGSKSASSVRAAVPLSAAPTAATPAANAPRTTSRNTSTAAANGSSDSGNVQLIIEHCPTSRTDTQGVTKYVFADPTFLVGPNCVICIDPSQLGPNTGNEQSREIAVDVNPMLDFQLVFNEANKATAGADLTPIGSYGGQNFYVKTQNGEENFSAFTLLIYEAMSQSSNTGNGKASGPQTIGLLVR